MDLSALIMALGCFFLGAYFVGAAHVARVLWFIFHLPTFLHYRKVLGANLGMFGRFCQWAIYIAVGWGWNLSWCGVIFAKHVLLGRGDIISMVFARQLFASVASQTIATSEDTSNMVLEDLKKVEVRFPHRVSPETSSSA